jgi:hypothetical protein
MKVTRSSILNLVLVAVLLGMLPSVIERLWQLRDPLLLTQNFVADLMARLTGPGRLRFVIQPLVAIILGVRGGVRDARAGLPPFLWALLFHAEHRREMWREAMASVRDLVVVAILLDLVAQALIFHEMRPGPALIIGPPLILIPYALSRACTNQIARRRAVHAPATHAH